jgi:hypothetical protein
MKMRIKALPRPIPDAPSAAGSFWRHPHQSLSVKILTNTFGNERILTSSSLEPALSIVSLFSA